MPIFRWLERHALGNADAVVSDDEEWLEPLDQGGLWEYQIHPLTVASLRRALDGLPDDTVVEVDLYDGSDSRLLRPMHIDVKGRAGVVKTVVITVH